MIQYWISHLETHLTGKSVLLINYLEFSLKCYFMAKRIQNIEEIGKQEILISPSSLVAYS